MNYEYVLLFYRKKGDMAELVTGTMSQKSGTRCLKFWYHMSGQDIGELKVTQRMVS